MDYAIQSPLQLATHLRALRKARGLSQQQLGAQLGLSQSRIARIEADPGSVSVEQFLAVLGALRTAVLLRPLDDNAAPRSASQQDAW
jgi:HTH-type transcriptional regulator/antitoxin HipB